MLHANKFYEADISMNESKRVEIDKEIKDNSKVTC